jgi:MFS family permease
MDSDSKSPSVASKRASPFAALEYRDYRLFWFGQLVSQAGTQMQQVTINWHIYILTGSALALGLTGLMRVVPIIAFSLIGGVFADAHDRRRVLLVTQSAMMIFAAMLGLVTTAGLASPAAIYLLAALIAAASAFDSPARNSLAPNLVPLKHLTNALSLNNILNRTASIVGPGLAGFVIAYLGIGAVYWFNSFSFLAVLVALVLMKTPTQKNIGAANVSLAALMDGIRYARQSTIVFSTMVLEFIASFFASASALLPIFANEILNVGSEGLGFLYAAQPVGAVIAGAVISYIGTIKRQGLIFMSALAVFGLATALYGGSQWFALSLFFLAVVGASDAVSSILRNTIRQLATPDNLRGRVQSLNMMFVMGGPQLGNLEAGIIAAIFGAPFSVISGGIATVIAVALIYWQAPQIRNYRA